MPVKHAICSPSLQQHPQSRFLLPLQAPVTAFLLLFLLQGTIHITAKLIFLKRCFSPETYYDTFHIISVRSSTSSSPCNTATTYLSKFYLLLSSKCILSFQPPCLPMPFLSTISSFYASFLQPSKETLRACTDEGLARQTVRREQWHHICEPQKHHLIDLFKD